MSRPIVVSEVFGPTIQGEGPSAGRRAGFVRLGRCDLACRWCDTPYTWDWEGQNGVRYDPEKELTEMTLGEVVAEVEAMKVHLVVITGGEPMVQREALTVLASSLDEEGFEVEVETNGRHVPGPDLVRHVSAFNVSPKLPNSGQPLSLTWVPRAIEGFRSSGKARFKFVCRDRDDVDLVARLAGEAGLDPATVWVMPEGQTELALWEHLRATADAAIAHGFNISGRLHIDIWSGARGH